MGRSRLLRWRWGISHRLGYHELFLCTLRCSIWILIIIIFFVFFCCFVHPVQRFVWPLVLLRLSRDGQMRLGRIACELDLHLGILLEDCFDRRLQRSSQVYLAIILDLTVLSAVLVVLRDVV